jgi:hypothetical protein
MVDLNLTISIITSDANYLNSPVKRQSEAGGMSQVTEHLTGQGPEFKPQHPPKKKKKIIRLD